MPQVASTAQTQVLDAPDVTILPAFEDTHNHLMLAAQNMGLVPVDQAHTLKAMAMYKGNIDGFGTDRSLERTETPRNPDSY